MRCDTPTDASSNKDRDHEEADSPAPPPKTPRLSDERLGIRFGEVSRLDPWVQQRHETARIIAMTSSGW